MAHINLNNEEPGITGLMIAYPKTAKILSKLAQELLVAENSLTRAERELIAAVVSYANGCQFCYNSHAAICAALSGSYDLVDAGVSYCEHHYDSSLLSPKIQALLSIAINETKNVRVIPNYITLAKNAGATDDEIHTTVLIAAAFNMYNRYVDGLGTSSSDDRKDYQEAGNYLARNGYDGPVPVVAESPEERVLTEVNEVS